MQESLVKYLSGLMDADGCLSFMFTPSKPGGDAFYVGLSLKLGCSEANDRHGFIDSLPALTSCGAVYGEPKQCKMWAVTKRADLEKLLPRLIKHMALKGKHWQWLLDTRRKQRGVPLTKTECEQLAIASKKSRVENVGPVKPKKHPTWAWLAGYLDGDGHYSYKLFNSSGYRLMNVNAVAHNNDASVLEFLQTAFGGYIYEHGGAKHVKRWRRNLGFRDSSFALRFLPKVAKHSRLKRHAIDQIIHLHRQQRLSVRKAAA
jgi:hypothetical protein